jgi:class 3 adenylate cyclase
MTTPASPAPLPSTLELPTGGTFSLASPCSIGRHVDNDVVLDLPALSRHHALIVASGPVYMLSDLHSRNGTFLNGAAISRPAALRDGDEIRFGDVVIRFHCKRRWFQAAAPKPVASAGDTTQRLDQVRERPCWLLLLDVAGYAALNEQLGSAPAVRHMQTWVAAVRPAIEQNGGHINGFFGDAVFAYWTADTAPPAQVLAALQRIEELRPRSQLTFRVVVHHGPAIFTHSDRGEELTGQSVNFVFRSEKIAKGFNASTMLSQTAMTSLGLEGRCRTFGGSAIDGMTDFFSFYALPPEFTPQPVS